MTENENTSKSKSSKIIILIAIILAITICGLAYYYSTENEKLNTQKSSLLKDLAKSKDSLDIVITENSSIKNELIVERQKILNLMEQVSQSNVSVVELNKYKAEVIKLRKQVSVLKSEKMELVKKYDKLKMSQDSTAYALERSNINNRKLESQNTDMNKMIRKSNKVSYVNLKTETLKQGLSGGAIVTNKALKVNTLKVSFMVVGTKLTSPIEKEYYVQVIDGDGNMLGKKLSKKFGPMILDFSYASKYKFDSDKQEVISDLDIPNSKIGTYIVNIFDKDELVLKTSFSLK